ncbi:FxSxx-COOH system tetratricopeptide repeat protein [Nocardiopsis potens]|uniref:FxSxx-COOH system tetratricopeptide repeat protein n=1 Tax=Nocardiopsis potens TaxID=1246458 RepID=UPI0003491773|nr:FxSxx-COOH system tetratricopeptide repeat protein [Nocardiopsis potens]
MTGRDDQERPRDDRGEAAQPPPPGPPLPGTGSPQWWEVGDAVWLAARTAAHADAAGGPHDTAAGGPQSTVAGGAHDAVAGGPQSAVADGPQSPPRQGDAVPPAAPAGPPPVRPGGPAGILPPAGRTGTAPAPGGPLAARPAAPVPRPELADRQGLVRALSRLRRRLPGPGRGPLDEYATAESYARRALAVRRPAGPNPAPLIPRFAPERRPADRLTVLVDAGLPMLVHEPLVEEFLALVEPLRLFRRTRALRFDSDKAWPDDLVLRAGHGPAPDPRELFSGAPSAAEVVLVLTDGAGEGWHRGAVQTWLARWGRRAAVAVLQVLDRPQWPRTGLRTRPLVLSAPGGAMAPNARYRVRLPAGALAPPPGEGGSPDAVPVPVLPLRTADLERWAGFVAQSPAVAELPVSAVPAEPTAEPFGTRPPEEAPLAADSSADPGELVAAFRETASPAAFELAVCLAAVPLNMPMVHAVREAFVPEATTADTAEALWSGLIARRPGGAPVTRADQVSLGFRPGVRAALLAAGGRRARIRALLETAVDRFGALPWTGPLAALLRGETFDPALPPVHDETAPAARALRPAMRALPGPLRRAAELWDVARPDSDGSGAAGAPPAVRTAAGHDRAEQKDEDVTSADPDFSGAGRQVATETSRAPVPEQAAPVERPAVLPAPPGPVRGPLSRSRPHVWGRIPQRNPAFVGRQELLDELSRRLTAGDTHILPQALRGMGGVGKTQLALEYAWRSQDRYELVWWIPADTPTQVQQALIDLAPRLGIDADRDPASISRTVLETLRSGHPYRDWLLVYDNAAAPEDIRPLLPSGGPGQVLITSRAADWRNAGGHLLEVDVFRREESVELLAKRGPESLTATDADLIADKLGDLPLAVEQTAVWLYETMMDPADWLEVFDEKQAELLSGVAPSPDYPWTVGATMNMALDRLLQTDPAALRLLQVCAFLAPQPVPRRLFNNARNVEGPAELREVLSDPAVRLGRVLRAIDRYALARMDHRTSTFQLHKLVQETLKLPLDDERRAEYRHCAHQLLANFDPGDPDSVADWPRYAELLPHIWETEQWDCESPWCRQLVLNEISFLHTWGRVKAARTLAETTVNHWTRHLGAEHPQTLRARARYAALLSTLGDFEEAHSLTLHVVDTLTRLRGAADEETLEVRQDLVLQLRNLGRFHEALEVSGEVLEAQERVLGRDDPLTLQTAHIHAVGLRLMGRLEEAMAIDGYNLQRRTEILGPENPRTLSSGYALAVGLMERAEFGKGLDLIEDCRTTAERVYPEDNQFRLGLLLLQATLLRRMGRVQEALALSEETYAIYLGKGAPEAFTTLQAAGCHSVALRAAGEYDQALALSERTLEGFRSAYNDRHPAYADVALNHAVILRLLGRADEARLLDEAALEVHTGIGEGHPSTIANAVNLASDLFVGGNPAKALELDERTLRTSRSALGDEHPLTLAAERNLLLDRAAVHGDACLEERKRVVARYALVFGSDHPATRSAAQDVRANCDLFPNLM